MSTKQQFQFEKQRLGSLNALEILDTAADKAFDNLVEMAAQIAGVPISLVSLVAEDRQWFKACVGLNVNQTPRSQSFCAHAIENGQQPLIVADAEADARFANNPLVVGEPFIRFYAGFPIKSPVDGMPLGTLCVIDQQPRELDEKTIGLLASVAQQVESLLELHHTVSQRRKSEEAYVIQQEQLNQALEAGNVGLWDWDAATGTVHTSPAYEKMLGIPADAGPHELGDWVRRLNPRDKDEVMAQREAYLSGESNQFEATYRLRHNDGFYRWIFSRGQAEFDADGKPLRMLGVHIDVTEQQEAEKAIVISRQMAVESERENRLLSAAIKNAKDAFLIAAVDANAELPQIVFVNEAFSKMTGYQIEDLDHADFKTFLNGKSTDVKSIDLIDDRVQHWQVAQEDMLVYAKDGTAFWASVKMAPIANDRNFFTHWLVIYRDINERVLADAALKSVSESRSAMVELLGSTDGVWDWDLTTERVEYQSGYRKLLGYDVNDRAGLPDAFGVFQQNLHPDDHDRVFAAQGRALDSDGLFDEEFRLKKKDGTYIWVHDRAAAIFDEDGKAIRMTGSIYDITERKKIEAALERERRLLTESNADLQQFASVASHDLQEPLRAVSGFLQLIETKYADQLDEQGRGYIEKSVAGASRMSQLINDLLLFSRVSRSSEGFEDVDLNEVVAEAQNDLEQTIASSQTRIEVDTLPTLKGARPLLTQLFRNLIGNSIKYRNEASPLIKIDSSVKDQVCTIRFQDNGIGIPDEYRQQVFELFKRLHRREEHSGTGIGLAICRRVVERHGGSIDVKPNEHPGTCFVIQLPLNDS